MLCSVGDQTKAECDRCVGESGGLPQEALDREWRKVSADWKIIDAHHLERVFDFPDFGRALAFTNLVGQAAEELGHHPDLCLSWGKVVVKIWTHKVDGLTKSDFELAGKIDEIARRG